METVSYTHLDVYKRQGVLRGPGLRLPLWLFGDAPHGDHPGAAGAGVRSPLLLSS